MGLYEVERIPERLKDAMTFRNLSFRMVAPAIGISHATVHRIMKGGVPDVESYLRVKAWLASESASLLARARALTE
jgi:hypothetical protein